MIALYRASISCPKGSRYIEALGLNIYPMGGQGWRLQLAANAKGRHTYKLHSDFVRLAMQLADSTNLGIYATINGKNTYSKCLALI